MAEVKKDKETRNIQGNESQKERALLVYVMRVGLPTVGNIPSPTHSKSGVDHGSIDGIDGNGIGNVEYSARMSQPWPIYSLGFELRKTTHRHSSDPYFSKDRDEWGATSNSPTHEKNTRPD